MIIVQDMSTDFFKKTYQVGFLLSIPKRHLLRFYFLLLFSSLFLWVTSQVPLVRGLSNGQRVLISVKGSYAWCPSVQVSDTCMVAETKISLYHRQWLKNALPVLLGNASALQFFSIFYGLLIVLPLFCMCMCLDFTSHLASLFDYL